MEPIVINDPQSLELIKSALTCLISRNIERLSTRILHGEGKSYFEKEIVPLFMLYSQLFHEDIY